MIKARRAVKGSARKKVAEPVAHLTEAQLLKAVNQNSLRLFPVGDIRVLFHLPDKAMRKLRRLASRDPETDPWTGDLTNPAQFAEWFWGRRRELEKMERNGS